MANHKESDIDDITMEELRELDGIRQNRLEGKSQTHSWEYVKKKILSKNRPKENDSER